MVLTTSRINHLLWLFYRVSSGTLFRGAWTCVVDASVSASSSPKLELFSLAGDSKTDDLRVEHDGGSGQANSERT
jgi:hypothetical protein